MITTRPEFCFKCKLSQKYRAEDTEDDGLSDSVHYHSFRGFLWKSKGIPRSQTHLGNTFTISTRKYKEQNSVKQNISTTMSAFAKTF